MEIVLELSNGQEVELKDSWEITDTDSYPSVEVIDCETNEVLCEFRGNVPDIEDGDFDLDEYIKKVEEEIDWYNC